MNRRSRSRRLRSRLLSEQLVAQSSVATGFVRIQNRQHERQDEENRRQPGRKLDQHVSGLGAEDVFRHPSAKGRTKSFALGTLHEDHQDH